MTLGVQRTSVTGILDWASIAATSVAWAKKNVCVHICVCVCICMLILWAWAECNCCNLICQFIDNNLNVMDCSIRGMPTLEHSRLADLLCSPRTARSGGTQRSDPLWSHLWTIQKKKKSCSHKPAHLSPYIPDTFWRAEHIMQPDPVDTGVVGATSTPVRCDQRSEPGQCTEILLWQLSKHIQNKKPKALPWVCLLDNLL